jgi:hypothetical protein
MSVRATPQPVAGAVAASPIHALSDGVGAVGISDGIDPLAEGNNYPTASADNPLKRTMNVSIKASINDFCLQRQKATWAPSSDALKAIFQQRKFTSLNGSSEAMGDLKAIVLHNLRVTHVKSSFPVSLGARITGVDDRAFSATGDSFSTIVLPESESHRVKELQSDDVGLAYEFASKFPGYTSDNLSTKGVHEVSQRRFVLIAADHPIVTAISENAEKLQMGEISMMPEGLVKISSALYNSILPLVRTQVDSQIKVRDMSRAQVSIEPADYSSWSEARNELMVEAKRPLKAKMQSEVSAAPTEEARVAIRAQYEKAEKALEHDIDFTPRDMHMEIEVEYNFLGNGKVS